MENAENKPAEKKTSAVYSKLEHFFENRQLWLLCAVAVLAFAIRAYYLAITQSQPIWWDEGEYLSAAKHWAFGTPFDVNPQRQPLLPFLLAILLKIGISNESLLKFLVVLLPSVASVILLYLFAREVADKRTAIISSFLLAVFWTHIFWTNRFSTDITGFAFTLLAYFALWKFYSSKQSKWLYIMGASLGLGFLTRVGGIIPLFVIIAFLLIAENISLLKKHWIFSGLIAFITIIPYLLWNQLHYNNILAFFPGYFDAAHTSEKLAKPIAWWIFNYFYQYNGLVFLILFLLGLVYLVNLFLGADIMLKNKDSPLRKDLFLLMTIILPMIFFVFIERNAEDRWLFAMVPAIFITISKGLGYVQDFLAKYNKLLAVLIVVALLAIGTYWELSQADSIIKFKKDSFAPVRGAGLWMKEHSSKDDVLFTNSVPQTAYYSERKINSLPSANTFEQDVARLKPKYMVLSLFDASVPEAYEYPKKYPQMLVPVQAYFADAEQKQATLIIYEFKY
ncbi:MAG TPA: phospholipid carrier-dependent glycosyltransferase [Nanoarchaeota archaeon]|nr:phospholipid carrier-dependent glycosyltransferase [Nanoarchaeota archaeon]